MQSKITISKTQLGFSIQSPFDLITAAKLLPSTFPVGLYFLQNKNTYRGDGTFMVVTALYEISASDKRLYSRF